MHKTMTIRRRVPVFGADGRIAFDAHREQAEKLMASGCAVAETLKGAVVTALRLTGVKLRSDIRAGSFGIRREHFDVRGNYGLSGGIVFDHKPTYERIAA